MTFELKQQRLHQAAESQGRHNADHAAHDCHLADLPQHHGTHARPVGAEGHPKADFAGSLGNGVGEHTVEADGREQGRERGESGASVLISRSRNTFS